MSRSNNAKSKKTADSGDRMILVIEADSSLHALKQFSEQPWKIIQHVGAKNKGKKKGKKKMSARLTKALDSLGGKP